MKKCLCFFLLVCSCVHVHAARLNKISQVEEKPDYMIVRKRSHVFNESLFYIPSNNNSGNNSGEIILDIKKDAYEGEDTFDSFKRRKSACCSSYFLFRVYCWAAGIHYKVR